MTPSQDLPILTDILRPGRVPPPLGIAPLLNDQERETLQQRIRLSVLQDLQNHIDDVVRQRLDETLNALVTHALADMTVELKRGLRETMADVVGRAVAQEISRLEAQSIN